MFQPIAELVVADDLSGELGGAKSRVVDVALDLRGRDRKVRDVSVGELDAVPGVLPALVSKALRRLGLVLDVAVPVPVSVPVDPVQRREDVVPAPEDEGVLAGWRWVYFDDPDGYPLELVEVAYYNADERERGMAAYLESRP